jgi:hypothetical protein
LWNELNELPIEAWNPGRTEELNPDLKCGLKVEQNHVPREELKESREVWLLHLYLRCW